MGSPRGLRPEGGSLNISPHRMGQEGPECFREAERHFKIGPSESILASGRQGKRLG